MRLSQLLKNLPHYTILATPTRARPDARPASGSPSSQNNPADTAEIDVTRITSDSRQVEPGAGFVAYRGINVDGHRFLPQALAQGAAVLVCESETSVPDQLFAMANPPPVIVVPDGREALAYLAAAWHGFPARHLLMTGITGTDGKTTTTNFLYHILKMGAKKKVSMINTVNAVIGDEVLETGLHVTTPDSLDVQRFLAHMVESKSEICLLEVTSHGLAHHRVTACDFDVAIVTNITHEHLDLHGSLAAYRADKAKLFESLATAAPKGLPKTAVLNCDDWSFEYLKEKLAPAGTKWLGYSLTDHPEAQVTARNIIYQADKTRFTIQGSNYAVEVETTLVGDYNVSNCLAAAAAALELFGAAPQAVQQGVAALSGIPGRMERIDEGQPFLAIVDFAHTPNALKRSLAVARTLTPGRVIAVFGCAGRRDVEKRVMMGHIAAKLADITMITAEDPRTENLDAIIAETAAAMLADGALEGETFERVPDRGRAIYRATQLAGPDDLVIVLGKGHEQSMCFGETEYAWDDRQAMRAALRGAPLLTLPSANW